MKAGPNQKVEDLRAQENNQRIKSNIVKVSWDSYEF